MQDAHGMRWGRESHVSAELLESVRELNRHFLDWMGASSGHWGTNRIQPPVELSGQVAPLSTAQKRAVAGCPYALFDLRFYDDVYWQIRLRSGESSVADEATVDQGTRDFARLALFFAWHVASTGAMPARLLLGMSESTAAAFRGATIGCVPGLVATEAVNLTARWKHCPTYWQALAGAAAQPNLAGLRRIQLYGLQLAAAECLV